MTQQEALFKYLLRWGDNALILSQRLSEWCSNAPFIEEDLALTNFALDLIGRAQAFLQYAANIEGKGNTEDTLAFRRNERQFYNNLMYELPNGDFGRTMVKQFFISAFEKELFATLQKSEDKTIAAIATKTLKEVKYHYQHAADWLVRLGNGTEESWQCVQTAVNDLWMYSNDLFEMDEAEQELVKSNIAIELNSLKANWTLAVQETMYQAQLVLPTAKYMQTGSRKGIHTEHLGHLLCEMQYLQRAYPDATW